MLLFLTFPALLFSTTAAAAVFHVCFDDNGSGDGGVPWFDGGDVFVADGATMVMTKSYRGQHERPSVFRHV